MAPGPATLELFSPEWAEAAREAMNRGPSAELRAKKIEKYWAWIDDAKPHIDAVWGLAARDLHDRPNCLLLHVEAGQATRAELVDLEEARRRATYLMVGDLAGWADLVAGYDVGKTIMYRRLLLEEGNVLAFFRGVYVWTESLAAIQELPSRLPQPLAA
ncbi:MAG: hypothetical protein GEV08_12045 [Acidimicrobiia bacterium]|nr:hypothetical protein [Acidimicrobiia bacterium]